ncbi:MAG: hypothetical protein LIP08_01120 [Bacteroides sp.]|nr:hypothetical protein [Bacteroides sp.]
MTFSGIILEDHDNDRKYELYRCYFQDGKFRVDESGNNLSVTWVYDRLEWIDEEITFNTPGE